MSTVTEPTQAPTNAPLCNHPSTDAYSDSNNGFDQVDILWLVTALLLSLLCFIMLILSYYIYHSKFNYNSSEDEKQTKESLKSGQKSSHNSHKSEGSDPDPNEMNKLIIAALSQNPNGKYQSRENEVIHGTKRKQTEVVNNTGTNNARENPYPNGNLNQLRSTNTDQSDHNIYGHAIGKLLYTHLKIKTEEATEKAETQNQPNHANPPNHQKGGTLSIEIGANKVLSPLSTITASSLMNNERDFRLVNHNRHNQSIDEEGSMYDKSVSDSETCHTIANTPSDTGIDVDTHTRSDSHSIEIIDPKHEHLRNVTMVIKNDNTMVMPLSSVKENPPNDTSKYSNENENNHTNNPTNSHSVLEIQGLINV